MTPDDSVMGDDTSTYRFCYAYERHFVAPHTHKLSNLSVIVVVVDNPLAALGHELRSDFEDKAHHGP